MTIAQSFRVINLCTSFLRATVSMILLILLPLCASPLASKEVKMTAAMEVRWAPPSLAPGYTVLDLSKTGTQTWFKFGDTEDVLIIPPPGTYTLDRLEISGGRNIILSGGDFVPAGGTATATLKFTNIHGQVWVEGVHVDNRNVGERDAIAAFAAKGAEGTFTLQNSFIDNVTGSYNGVHGDVFQPHGDLQHIRMYNVVGRSNFQGLFLDPQNEILSVDLVNVQMQYLPGGDPITFLYNFWMNDGHPPYPVTLENVWVDQRAGQDATQQSVFPPRAWGTVRTGDDITWPSMPFTGAMHIGTPPQGYLVGPDQTGLSYGRTAAELQSLWSGTPPHAPDPSHPVPPVTLPTAPPASGSPINYIDGTDGNDVVHGSAVNDQINGRNGDDTMIGGTGDDIYIVNRLRDMPVEKAGEGTDTVLTALEGYHLPDHVENLTSTTATGALLLGNALANRLQGGAGADTLDGGAGNDLLTGGAGADTFVLRHGGGQDIIQDFAPGDTLRLEGYGATSADAVKATAWAAGTSLVLELGGGERVILQNMDPSALAWMDIRMVPDDLGSRSAATLPLSQPSAVWLKGTAGDDDMTGTPGHDYLNGQGGNNTLRGGLGDDRYNVGGMQDTVIEKAGEGIDTVQNWGRYYRLPDHVENLDLMRADGAVGVGNDMDNVLTGSASDDVLYGMGGNDRLIGGPGNDVLIGGAGRDVFRAAALGHGCDVVVDFQSGIDRLDLRAIVQEVAGGVLELFANNLRIVSEETGLTVQVMRQDVAGDFVSVFHLEGVTHINPDTDIILTDATA